MTTPEIKTLLETSQNLAGSTKSYVDTNVKVDVSNIERQAAVAGYLGVLFSASESLYSQFSRPAVVDVFKKLGGVAAVAGAGFSIKQYSDAYKQWEANKTPQNFDVVLEKASGVTASLGSVIFLVPGGQVIGGAIFIGGSLLENHYNGNFSQLGGIAGDVALGIGKLLKPLQTQPYILVKQPSPAPTVSPWENSRTPGQNVAAGLSPDGRALNVWTEVRIADGTAVTGARSYTFKTANGYETYQSSGSYVDGNLQEIFKVQDASGNVKAIQFSRQDTPGGPLVAVSQFGVSASGKLISVSTTAQTPADLGTPARNSAALVTNNGSNSHTYTINTGGTISDIWLLQKNAGNVFTLEDFSKAVLAANPGITDINQVPAGQVVYIPENQVDGSITYHYSGGATVNSNIGTGEYNMVVSNADGGQTVYSRTNDENALGGEGYTIKQVSTNAAAQETYRYEAHQNTDGEVTRPLVVQPGANGQQTATAQIGDNVATFSFAGNPGGELVLLDLLEVNYALPLNGSLINKVLAEGEYTLQDLQNRPGQLGTIVEAADATNTRSGTAAMRDLFACTHNVAEGAGAASFAAAMQERTALQGQVVGTPLCGGNVDSDVFAKVLRN